MLEMGPAQVWMSDGGVPPEELENAMNWAFGQDWQGHKLADSLRLAWNLKHGNIFIADENSKISIFFWSIGKAYMEANFDQGKKSSFTEATRKRKIFSIPGLIRGLGKGGF